MRTLLLAAALAAWAGSTHQAEIEAWRADREARLKTDDGWLTLTGLFWLQEGDNRVGSAPGSRVELPSGFVPDAGVIRVQGKKVTFQPSARGGAEINGQPIKGTVAMQTDAVEHPDVLSVGRLKMLVIDRGGKLGVRLKDPQSEARRNFKGLRWFPIQQEWQMQARFIPQPRKMVFDAQAGDKQEKSSPGYVEFTWRGQKLRLTPVTEEGQLFFIFRDKTAGKSTYPAARFLYADLPKNGMVTVDFNKAYNPPCVFTPYATCPLPPPENRLQVAVEAGEMMYHGGVH